MWDSIVVLSFFLSFFLPAFFFLAFFGVEKKKQECQIVCFWCVAVVQFARATGDLQALSEVDLKLIALAYTLEAQAHGTSHLRSKPPPLQVYFSLHRILPKCTTLYALKSRVQLCFPFSQGLEFRV